MIITLENKIALVTGGAKGLGKAIVNKLNASGAIVFLLLEIIMK